MCSQQTWLTSVWKWVVRPISCPGLPDALSENSQKELQFDWGAEARFNFKCNCLFLLVQIQGNDIAENLPCCALLLLLLFFSNTLVVAHEYKHLKQGMGIVSELHPACPGDEGAQGQQ